MTAACLSWRAAGTQWKTWSFDRYHLPGFDAFVYAAMAEDPAYFTVGPWGYRVLTPWLVHALRTDDVVPGFRLVSRVALFVAGVLLYWLLRRHGHGELLSLAGVAAFCASEPVEQALTGVLLVEPVGIVVLLLLLLALESGSAVLVAPVLALGVLTKETFFLSMPTVVFALAAHRGFRRSLAPSVGACLPALVGHFVLRQWWAPYPDGPWPIQSLDAFWAAVYRILAAWPAWWGPVVACGLPLALIGAGLPAGRQLLKRHGYLLLLTLAVPFAAWTRASTRGPSGEWTPATTFFVEDVPRLLLYAMPLLLSLALVALRRLLRREPPDIQRSSPGRGLETTAALVTLLALAFPFLVLDRYRRLDLRGPRDGPYVLALCRETLAFARRLERGKVVVYEPTGRRFHGSRSDRRHLERMRWFLRAGWGPFPHYGMEDVEMREAVASVVLPCLAARDLQLMVALGSDRPVRLELAVNGYSLGAVLVTGEGQRHRLQVPGHALFRGDNLLTMTGADAPSARVRLLALNLRLASSGSSR